MNEIIKSDFAIVPLHDATVVADIAMRQVTFAPMGVYRSVSDLFLHDAFSLGYAIGFTEQACWHAKNGNGEKNCPDFLRRTISQMVGNEATAAAFVSYAVSKQGERLFEGGYDAGMSDLDAWYLSQGAHIPDGLLQYLTNGL